MNSYRNDPDDDERKARHMANLYDGKSEPLDIRAIQLKYTDPRVLEFFRGCRGEVTIERPCARCGHAEDDCDCDEFMMTL